jgi:hypothetical protein
MIKRVMHRRAAWLVLVPLAAVSAFVLASASTAARSDLPAAPTSPGPPLPPPHSRPLHGHFRNVVQHFGCPESPIQPPFPKVCSTFDADGSIKGDGFVVVDTFPSFDPLMEGFSEANTVIHTDRGDLRCNEAALFDSTVNPDDQPFVDLCLIDGAHSTGDYLNATGYIQEVGTFPKAVGVGTIEYFGKITLVGH